MAKVTITDLLEAGCHFGHQTRRWNPKMKEYVYGAKNGISIIDLGKTMYQIAAACNFLQNVVVKGGDILFVGTKRQARELTREIAEKTGMYHVSERWLGGTLTNNVTIRKSIAKMAEIDATLQSDAVKGMKKKEVSMLTRNAEKLHRDLDGIARPQRERGRREKVVPRAALRRPHGQFYPLIRLLIPARGDELSPGHFEKFIHKTPFFVAHR